MNASHAIWRRALLALALLVSATFVGVFLLGGGRADVSGSGGSAEVGAASLTSQDSASAASQLALGRTLFVENCSTCHGIGAYGGDRAPPLLGVGGATVDLWLSSGWMPLREPTAEPVRKPAAFNRPEILAIVRYVTSLAPALPGNPGIPFNLDISHANVAVGFSLFALNCAPCHTITGAGDALANGIQAPPLHGVTKTMVYEAIRTGPGNMPRFGPGTLSRSQVIDVVGYVVNNIEHPYSPGGISLGGVGPVAEGFVGLFVGVGACLLAAFWVGDRTEPEEDEGHGDDGHGDDGHGDDGDDGHGGHDHRELAHA
ncbi:MAG TPA: c-type cytochrome [Acidimicrobiales bacterium]|nr:c-type cytochrome [Acidimicrobiales bacterium]